MHENYILRVYVIGSMPGHDWWNSIGYGLNPMSAADATIRQTSKGGSLDLCLLSYHAYLSMRHFIWI